MYSVGLEEHKHLPISLPSRPRKYKWAWSYPYRRHLQRQWGTKSKHNRKYSYIYSYIFLYMGLCEWPDAMEEGKLSECSSSALYSFVALTTRWSMGKWNIFFCFSPRTSLINRLSNSYMMEWQKWSCFLRNVSGGEVFKGLGVSLLYLMGPLAHKHFKQRNNRSLGEF